jgi:hypothetical protein
LLENTHRRRACDFTSNNKSESAIAELFRFLSLYLDGLNDEAKMALLRVLIVEDEPLISMQIEEIVEETVPAVVIIRSSVREAKAVIDEPFHLALLDVDVTNGKTSYPAL